MSEIGRKTVVSVQIAGEEYTIRTDASVDYTRECADYVDHMVRDILDSTSSLHPQKAAVLAALAITDQLFKAQREVTAARDHVTQRSTHLADEISHRLGEPGSGLAMRS